MVNRVILGRKLCDLVPDWIWPHLTGCEEPAPQDQDEFSAKHVDLLDEVSRVLLPRLDQVEERNRTVETKLLALLTLTSVLSVAVTGGVAVASRLGTVEEETRFFAWVAVVIAFYLTLQLLCSLRVTVAGLMRRSYKQLRPEDIVPKDGESNEGYRVRLLNLQVNHMRWNEWVVNQKVSEMAVAHVALTNALFATFLIIVLMFVIAFVHLA